MPTITFDCETITPMFLAGADGQTPELRAPSIKGALRFWWRAMNGHLGLEKMQACEAEIFGNIQQKSKLIIRIQPIQLDTAKVRPVAHRTFERSSFNPKQIFQVILQIRPSTCFDIKKAEALFVITCLLGGFGYRSRRGFGSIYIVRKDNNSFEMPSSLETITRLLNQMNTDDIDHFTIGADEKERPCIESKFEKPIAYPYIKQIQIGRPQSSLPSKISDTMNHFHRNDVNYENSMGRARGGRWASPVYVSVLKDKENRSRSIITTLNAVPPKNSPQRVDEQLQRSFKNALL